MGLALNRASPYRAFMTLDTHDWFATALSALAEPQGQRVWSIIISFLGDMAQDEGAGISSAALTRVITPLGIKPEAIRVALHRLRKDGWTESERRGRGSRHFLTPYGRAQSALVTPRIYARTACQTQAWHLLIAGTPEGLEALDALGEQRPQRAIRINRHTGLATGHAEPTATATSDMLVANIEIAHVPQWLQEELFPEPLRQSCAELDRALAPLGPPPELNPLQRACLRTLLVHRWRRIALRHADLPGAFHPGDWAGESCRSRVFALLDQLPLPKLIELEDASPLPSAQISPLAAEVTD